MKPKLPRYGHRLFRLRLLLCFLAVHALLALRSQGQGPSSPAGVGYALAYLINSPVADSIAREATLENFRVAFYNWANTTALDRTTYGQGLAALQTGLVQNLGTGLTNILGEVRGGNTILSGIQTDIQTGNSQRQTLNDNLSRWLGSTTGSGLTLRQELQAQNTSVVDGIGSLVSAIYVNSPLALTNYWQTNLTDWQRIMLTNGFGQFTNGLEASNLLSSILDVLTTGYGLTNRLNLTNQYTVTNQVSVDPSNLVAAVSVITNALNRLTNFGMPNLGGMISVTNVLTGTNGAPGTPQPLVTLSQARDSNPLLVATPELLRKEFVFDTGNGEIRWVASLWFDDYQGVSALRVPIRVVSVILAWLWYVSRALALIRETSRALMTTTRDASGPLSPVGNALPLITALPGWMQAFVAALIVGKEAIVLGLIAGMPLTLATIVDALAPSGPDAPSFFDPGSMNPLRALAQTGAMMGTVLAQLDGYFGITIWMVAFFSWLTLQVVMWMLPIVQWWAARMTTGAVNPSVAMIGAATLLFAKAAALHRLLIVLLILSAPCSSPAFPLVVDIPANSIGGGFYFTLTGVSGTTFFANVGTRTTNEVNATSAGTLAFYHSSTGVSGSIAVPAGEDGFSMTATELTSIGETFRVDGLNGAPSFSTWVFCGVTTAPSPAGATVLAGPSTKIRLHNATTNTENVLVGGLLYTVAAGQMLETASVSSPLTLEFPARANVQKVYTLPQEVVTVYLTGIGVAFANEVLWYYAFAAGAALGGAAGAGMITLLWVRRVAADHWSE